MTSMFQYNDQIPDFISCGYLITTYGVILILVVTYAEYLFFLGRSHELRADADVLWREIPQISFSINNRS